jgi:hypothetical protein
VAGSSRSGTVRTTSFGELHVGKRLLQAFVTLKCMPRSRWPRGPGKRRRRRGREAFLAACKLGWGRGGAGLPVSHNESCHAKREECDEQREEVEFHSRIHFKISWLEKVIINHAGSAPDRNRRVWICLKSQGPAAIHVSRRVTAATRVAGQGGAAGVSARAGPGNAKAGKSPRRTRRQSA